MVLNTLDQTWELLLVFQWSHREQGHGASLVFRKGDLEWLRVLAQYQVNNRPSKCLKWDARHPTPLGQVQTEQPDWAKALHLRE